MISSLDNKQVKEVIKLNQKGRARREAGVFIIEGEHLFSEVSEDELVKVFVSESFKDTTGRLKRLCGLTEHKDEDLAAGKLVELAGKNASSKVEVVSDEVFKKMTDTLTPQGVLCIVKQRNYSLDEMLENAIKERDEHGRAPLFLVLEGIQDPGNLGTIMRTAEGAGASGIIMSKETVDLYNPKTVRSTMGSIFRVPFLYTDDLKGAVMKLKEASIPSFAAHLKGTKCYKDVDYSHGAVFFIGNEGNGLTDETAGLADEYVIIPMQGRLESLNAAVSAALLMYAL